MCRYELDIRHGTVEKSVKFDIYFPNIYCFCLLASKLNVHTKPEKNLGY